MIIRRANHGKGCQFTPIAHSVIRDERLTPALGWFFVRLLSLPESIDESISAIAAMFHMKWDTVDKYLKKLEEFGYVSLVRPDGKRGKDGKQLPVRFMVIEQPEEVKPQAPARSWVGSSEPCPDCLEEFRYAMLETDGEAFRCPMCGVVYASLDDMQGASGDG